MTEVGKGREERSKRMNNKKMGKRERKKEGMKASKSERKRRER